MTEQEIQKLKEQNEKMKDFLFTIKHWIDIELSVNYLKGENENFILSKMSTFQKFQTETEKMISEICDKEQEILDCASKPEESDKSLKAENEGLKKQLKDYENTLSEYADEKNWYDNHSPYTNTTEGVYMNCEPNETGFELAKETLRKWKK